MATKEQIVIAFDLYGTLLSTESIANELSATFGMGKATDLAALWRRYQLEYTWRLNSMKQYQPFSTVTRNSLGHALAERQLSLDDAATDKLMEAYDSLSTFSDVAPALEALAKEPSIAAVVFSNGTEQMVGQSVHSSPDLGPHASVFKSLVTVEAVNCFKPDPSVYYHLAEQVGKGKSRAEMNNLWMVSANPFDIVGALSVGMKAAWVDRNSAGWLDALAPGEVGRPTITVKGLGEVIESVKQSREGSL